MELQRSSCVVCRQNMTVLSSKDSMKYFNLLKKDNYCSNNVGYKQVRFVVADVVYGLIVVFLVSEIV